MFRWTPEVIIAVCGVILALISLIRAERNRAWIRYLRRENEHRKKESEANGKIRGTD